MTITICRNFTHIASYVNSNVILDFFRKILIKNYPSIRILVSKTETTISLSKVTSLITSFIARLNSEKSPITASVSKLSTRVKEKLKQKKSITSMSVWDRIFAFTQILQEEQKSRQFRSRRIYWLRSWFMLQCMDKRKKNMLRLFLSLSKIRNTILLGFWVLLILSRGS